MSKHTTEELNSIVADYKGGSVEAASKLIEAFSPILDKYSRLCVYGIWDPSDGDINHFLRMLGGTDTQTTASELARLLKAYETEDIKQEAILALLLTAKKYMAIAPNFKYTFKKQIQQLIRDPLVCKTKIIEGDEYYSLDKEPELDSEWVSGKTAGYGWNKLTAKQRAIIKLKYLDGYSDKVIAAMLHLKSYKSVKTNITNSKKILGVYLKEEIRRLG